MITLPKSNLEFTTVVISMCQHKSRHISLFTQTVVSTNTHKEYWLDLGLWVQLDNLAGAIVVRVMYV